MKFRIEMAIPILLSVWEFTIYVRICSGFRSSLLSLMFSDSWGKKIKILKCKEETK